MKSVSADIVYGKIVPSSAADKVVVTRKSSISYVGGDKTRKNSGSPGYLKGMPIKTGDKFVPDDVKKVPYINEPINGFQLLAGDNQG